MERYIKILIDSGYEQIQPEDFVDNAFESSEYFYICDEHGNVWYFKTKKNSIYSSF